MSKRAGSAPSGYQPDRAATGARPAAPSSGQASAEPSWPQVIATTARLWLQRHGMGRGPGAARPQTSFTSTPSPAPARQAAASQATVRPAPPRPATERQTTARQTTARQPGWARPASASAQRPFSRRRIGVFGVVIVVFAAGALTIALAQGRTTTATREAGNGQSVKLSNTALREAAANRAQAAAWVAAQVSHGVIVACDPVMCAALQARGFPAGDLLALTSQATDPMGAQIVVSTTALRDQFGGRLPDVYAPVVLASFGTGQTQVAIRVEAPDGSQAYLVAARADLLARQASGRQLLHNKFLHVYGSSRLAISAGRVDPRLLITLAALTAQGHNVYISRFGDAGPGASGGVPLRMMRISALAAVRHGKYLASVLRFLRAQQSPYRAATQVVHVSPTVTVIQIEFAAPSPLGLLGAHPAP